MNKSTTEPKRSYSQFGEDQVILNFFGKAYKGVFLDVGANDGCQGSNSMLLELHGWRGFLVEPIARLADICRRSRPNSIVINKAAVGDPTKSEVEFFEYYGIHSVGDNYDGLSSVGVPSALEPQARAGGASVKKTVVSAITIDQMLSENGFVDSIDFVSIDVEGLELEVLKGFSLEQYRPRLLVVEDNTFGEDKRVFSYLKSHGYFRVHRTGVNDWYVSDNDKSRFVRRRINLGLRLTAWKMCRLGRSVFRLGVDKKRLGLSSCASHS